MVLSKREKVIAAATAGVVVLLVLDQFVLSPFLDHRERVQTQIDSLRADVARWQTTISRSRQSGQQWREMLSAGMKTDPGEAESQALHALRRWADEARLALSLLKPDRLTQKTRLGVITFQASGSGRLDGIRRMLWQVQTTSLPVQVNELQITSRKDGADDLTFQMKVSTVHVPPTPVEGGASTQAAERPQRTGGS